MFSYSAPPHNQAAPASWDATTTQAGVGGLRTADIGPSFWVGSGSFLGIRRELPLPCPCLLVAVNHPWGPWTYSPTQQFLSLLSSVLALSLSALISLFL